MLLLPVRRPQCMFFLFRSFSEGDRPLTHRRFVCFCRQLSKFVFSVRYFSEGDPPLARQCCVELLNFATGAPKLLLLLSMLVLVFGMVVLRSRSMRGRYVAKW